MTITAHLVYCINPIATKLVKVSIIHCNIFENTYCQMSDVSESRFFHIL